MGGIIITHKAYPLGLTEIVLYNKQMIGGSACSFHPSRSDQ